MASRKKRKHEVGVVDSRFDMPRMSTSSRGVSHARLLRSKLRDSWRGLHSWVAQRFEPTKRLTIVVPAYNVEAYLAECLDSLIAQTYRDIEIIIIVDGATDRTLDIASQYAAKHKRIAVRWQENAGLSAARNAGAARARGEFLWFVDSDDTVAPNAAEKMVTSLQTTGSDFAVASYHRFNSNGSRKPGSWILAAHEAARLRVTAHDFPDILVNAVAVSKVYRRSFWDEHGFSFPVGARYEDQPVSARAYALATAIDVLPDVVYHWRERDDGSSISQQSHLLSDLSARMDSAIASLEVLRECGAPTLAVERAVQLLSNDLPHSMNHLEDAKPEFWAQLASGVQHIARDVPLHRWREIPSHRAALEWLLLDDDISRARQYVERKGQDSLTLSSVRIGDDLVLCVPFWDDPKVAYPVDVLALAPRQTKLVVRLRRARWESNGTLVLEGWAYIPLVPQEDSTDIIAAALVSDGLDSDEDEPHTVPLPLEVFTDLDINRVSSHELNDHSGSAFRCTIDIDRLGLNLEGAYTLHIDVTARGLRRTAAVRNVDPGGSAWNLPPSTSQRGVTARLQCDGAKPLKLRLRKASVAAQHVGTTRDTATLELQSSHPLQHIEIRASGAARGNSAGARRISASAQSIGDDKYRVVLDAHALSSLRETHWTVRAIDTAAEEYSIDWPAPNDAPLPILGPAIPVGLAWIRTGAGNLGFRRYSPTVHIESIVYSGDGIALTGRTLGTAAPPVVLLRDHRQTIECQTTQRTSEGRFEATIPYQSTRWGRTGPLPIGRYDVTIGDGTNSWDTSLGESAAAALPLWAQASAPIAARMEFERKAKLLSLTVEPTLTAEERGQYPKAQMIQQHQTGQYTLAPREVLFDTCYGENASGNALGIHHELRRRGANLALFWAVQDSSVRVPEGGTPVVVDSRRWFELLSTAKYLVDDVHQPSFFTKRPGQVLIQTLHGYPLDAAGQTYWEAAGYGQSRIDSFLARQQQWDFLLSPAPYATPLLKRELPSRAEILEIGYPRNDIFFAEQRHALREQTRQALGVGPNVTAVLYASTRRDKLVNREFRPHMVDFLDTYRMAEALGENYVILVRGRHTDALFKPTTETPAERVVDVTDYPEISELCLASDAAILDYSPLRFDYALTGKPMIFHVPDLENYRDDVHALLPYEETAPGPLVRNTDDVIAALQHLPDVSSDYADARQTFLRTYMPLGDGRAGERLVNAVFGTEAGS